MGDVVVDPLEPVQIHEEQRPVAEHASKWHPGTRRLGGFDALGEVELRRVEVALHPAGDAEQPGGDKAQQAAVDKIRGALGDSVEYRRVEVVGPRVSTELLAYGTLGLVLAILHNSIHLERIGDQCVTIAKLTKLASELEPRHDLVEGLTKAFTACNSLANTL